MDYNNILAAKLNLDIDYNKITEEILACKDSWVYTPPLETQINDGLENRVYMVADEQTYKDCDHIVLDTSLNYKTENSYSKGINIVTNKNRGPDIFYLTTHVDSVYEAEAYRFSKRRNLDGWKWRDDLVDKVPYFKQVAESMFKKIGLIRVFIMHDTFLVTHRDYVSDQNRFYDFDYYSPEFDRVLGLSLIPSTGDVPMKIWSRQDLTFLPSLNVSSYTSLGPGSNIA